MKTVFFFFFNFVHFFFSFGFIKRKVFYLWDIHGNCTSSFYNSLRQRCGMQDA